GILVYWYIGQLIYQYTNIPILPLFSPAMYQAWVKRIAQAVAEEVEGENGDRDGDARGKDEMRGAEKLVAFAAEHTAPFGNRLLSAEADEGERGRFQNRTGNTQRDEDDQGRKRVGKNAAEEDAKVTGSQS